jgi:multisubunit Na+/H+ antiporter MnhB subunit
VYVTFVFVAMIGLFAWSIGFDFGSLAAKWPAAASIAADVDTQLERAELRTGALLTVLVCLSALLMPIVKDRAARVLVLGTCGFSVTAVYYLYKAPDLALTQVSIEIVSLILFLLVLSLLPTATAGRQVWIVPRLMIAGAVGAIAFWLTLTSSVGARPTMPYLTAQHKPVAHLGEYFLRNSYHAKDTLHVPAAEVYGGVVDRGEAHLTSFGTGGHDDAGHEGAVEPAAAAHAPTQTLHKGGGGRNVVNVILVDFRGFDTLGEITVLGLAALGVRTLLRRSRRSAQASGPGTDIDESSNGTEDFDQSPYTRIDIPEPTGGIDPEDSALRSITQGGAQS